MEEPTTDKPGVSVTFFAKVMKALPGGGNKPVPIPMLNEWIAALGKIERDYRSLVAEEKAKKL
jgi:hypothetical protein